MSNKLLLKKEIKLIIFLQYLQSFFNPTVDAVINDFLQTVTRLEQIAQAHQSKAQASNDRAQQLLQVAEQFATEADRAAKIAVNIKNIVKV